MQILYPVGITEHRAERPEGAGFSAVFPDLPEAITCGADRQAALLSAIDCLEEALAARIKARDPLPPPGPARGSGRWRRAA